MQFLAKQISPELNEFCPPHSGIIDKTHMHMPTKAAQIRIARPTDNLHEVINFYHHGLDLPIIGAFEKHDGYDGVMIGLPGAECHLEFTQHVSGSPCPAPTKDNLLVLYFDKQAEYAEAAERLQAQGHLPVTPENPYWEDKSLTFEDPDGWRVVLFNGLFQPGT